MENIPLRNVYCYGVRTVPWVNHDEKDFLIYVINELKRDSIRTRAIQAQINKKWLDFVLSIDWPLNDFYYALEKYLKARWFRWRFPQIDTFRNQVFHIMDA